MTDLALRLPMGDRIKYSTCNRCLPPYTDMSLDFDYSNTPLPLNSVTNYGLTDPNAGHFGSFDMRCGYNAWASTWRLFFSITFLML